MVVAPPGVVSDEDTIRSLDLRLPVTVVYFRLGPVMLLLSPSWWTVIVIGWSRYFSTFCYFGATQLVHAPVVSLGALAFACFSALVGAHAWWPGLLRCLEPSVVIVSCLLTRRVSSDLLP